MAYNNVINEVRLTVGRIRFCGCRGNPAWRPGARGLGQPGAWGALSNAVQARGGARRRYM